MKIDLGKAGEIVSKPISLGELGEFHLHVKPPTYADLMKDAGRFSDYQEPRIKSVVTGWAGLTQDVTAEDGTVSEQEIPYTFENLQKVCEQFPSALRQIIKIANDAYSGGESAKNGVTASGQFSADAVLQQMGLPNGLLSGVSRTSPAQSA